MRWRGRGAVLVTVSVLFLWSGPAAAQVQVSIGGLVESIAGIETRRATRSTGATSIDRRLVWGSRYSPVAEGFVWNRRFVTYSLGASWIDETTRETETRTESLHTEPYRLQLTFFPEAAHTFTVRAARSSFTTDTFAENAGGSSVTTTLDSQGFSWGYRGSAVLPSAGLEFTRGTSATEASDGPSRQTLTRIGLHAAKSFSRAEPTLRYRLDMLEDDRPLDPGGEASRIGHTFEYSDRIRIGERLFITPSATYQIDPVTEGLRSVTTIAVPLAGPIDPTLDGAANFRYSLAQGEELSHTVASDGTLTKRLSRDLALSGGLSGVLVRGADSDTWAAGGFTNVDAAPVPKLRGMAGYALNFSGTDAGITTGHRGQLRLTSAHVPLHTMTGAYFLNVIDVPREGDLLVSQSWRADVTSVALPRTILDLGYGLGLEEGNGQQVRHDVGLNGTLTLPVAVSLRGGVDVFRRSASGGGREALEETGWGLQAGVDGTPLDWLTLSLAGRRAAQTVQREDRDGEFVSERFTGGATVVWRTFQLRTDAFLDREPVDRRQGYGLRGTVSYRFRVWTLSVDFEQSWHTTSGGVDIQNQRVLFRLTRALAHFFSLP